MLRTLNLAKRSSLLLLVAGTLATGLSAQHPVLTTGVNQLGDEINFSLSNPTSGGTRRAFLACYFAMEGDGGNLSNVLKKSTGAVAPYSSTAPGASFDIPNANTTTPNAIPTSEFTVPPSIIAHAINDVNWAHHSEFMHTFAGSMAWTSTGLGGPNSSAALDWPAFASGLVIPNTTSDTILLARALVARQIGYVENLPPTDISVQTKAKAVVDTCALDEQLISFNTVLVEVQELPSNNEPVKIKLSRSHKVTLRLPGSGQNNSYAYHWNGVYATYPDHVVEIAAFAPDFQSGLHQMFVPTTAGIVAVDMEVRTDGATPMLAALMPANVIAGQFAIFNWSTMQYVLMDNGSEFQSLPVLTNWLHMSLYGLAYNPIPMPNFGAN